MIGIGIGIVGMLIGVLIAVIQGRSPDVSVECKLDPNNDPSCIECTVFNKGLAEAKDVYVGFNNMLPLDTTIFFLPELGLELHEANLPPDPNILPHVAHLTKAFSVRIPRVARKSEITFQVKTINKDNIRAANQVLRIREEIINILTTFGERLSLYHSEEYSKWDAPTIIQARIKQENFFTPGKFSYVNGQFPVVFISDDDELALAANQDLYSKYKKEHVDVFSSSKEFKAPVLRIKTPRGESAYAIFPPYVNTFTEVMIVPLNEISKKGSISIAPPVPESYD